MNKFSLTTLLAAGLSIGSAQAAVLVQYDFDQIDPGNSNFNVDYSATTATGVSANNFSDAIADGTINDTDTSLTSFFQITNTTTPAFSGAAVLWQSGGLATGTDDDMAGAIAANQFVSFTVTTNALSLIDLDTLTFTTAANGTRNAMDLEVRSSADNYGSSLLSVNNFPDANTGHNVDLSAVTFDSLDTIEFRIYFDDRQGNNNGGSGTAIDNVILNGSVVAVPEPSSSALLGLGGLALLLRRRK